MRYKPIEQEFLLRGGVEVMTKSFALKTVVTMATLSLVAQACAGGEDAGATAQQAVSAPAAVTDIRGHLYENDIKKAVADGLVVGFPDGTFKPDATLTREQGVALLSKILGRVPADFTYEVATDLPSEFEIVFSDMAVSRWSYPAVLTAAENGLVAGYPDGTFKPTQELTRAEFMAMLRRSATFVRASLSLSQNLPATVPAVSYSDLSSHWAAGLVRSMQTFCNVASPLNETGTQFAPNAAISRGYAAAAAVRYLSCITQGSANTDRGAFEAATLQNTSEFVVTTAVGLNCREFPNTSSTSLYGLLQGGQFLHAHRETADRNITATDSTGRVWIHVRPHGFFADATCWVAANRENIAPL